MRYEISEWFGNLSAHQLDPTKWSQQFNQPCSIKYQPNGSWNCSGRCPWHLLLRVSALVLQHVLSMSIPTETIWTLIWMQLFFGSLLIARNLLTNFEVIHKTFLLCKGFSAIITGEMTNCMPFLVVGDFDFVR